MRIGVIGSGNIGGTLARRFAAAGHEVAVANTRGPQSLADLAAETGARAAGSVAEAADGADVVVVAVPLKANADLPADALAGRIVVDTTNYYPERDGHVPALDARTTSSSSLLADHLAGSRVVKAFNTIHWQDLLSAGRPAGDPERLAVPVAGDDEHAKDVVARLADQIGFDVVDAGTLADSRDQEPGTPVYGARVGADDARELLHGGRGEQGTPA